MQYKTPERRCTGCGNTIPKKDLLRVVREPDGTISVDSTGKKSGRGAYICNKKECFLKAQKTKRLENSLKCSISPEVYQNLQSRIQEEESHE
ncbi:MAG: YlxR family protein [Clostridia bacterium]|nr:YlxR family protein [Clostridia bacterium]